MINLFDLSGKTAVITGGTGVLGSAMAMGLAQAGANVVVIGRKKESGDKVVKAIQEVKGQARFVSADVLDEAQLVKARQEILDTFGKIDILINAAGGNMPGAII